MISEKFIPKNTYFFYCNYCTYSQIMVSGHFAESHFTEGHFAEAISPKGHFAEGTFHQMDISLKGHFAKWSFRRSPFRRSHFIEWTFRQMDISQNPFRRMVISPKITYFIRIIQVIRSTICSSAKFVVDRTIFLS
jgi:hypothetical protein